jgi:hypothetical protein
MRYERHRGGALPARGGSGNLGNPGHGHRPLSYPPRERGKIKESIRVRTSPRRPRTGWTPMASAFPTRSPRVRRHTTPSKNTVVAESARLRSRVMGPAPAVEGRKGRKGRKPRTVASPRSANTAARITRERGTSFIVRRLYGPPCPRPIMGNGRLKMAPEPRDKPKLLPAMRLCPGVIPRARWKTGSEFLWDCALENHNA